MPVVPFAKRPDGAPMPNTRGIDPTMFVMAAAELHEADRLIEPEYRDAKEPAPPSPPKDAA